MPTLYEIQAYWDAHPAGEAEVAQLAADRRAFFDERDRQTRLLYPQLDADYGFAKSSGKRTLELGCGLDYNAQRLAQSGARLGVMDLAPRAVQLTRERFALRKLAADFLVADAENLPFSTGTFELVFSSGVIHHTPDTEQAGQDIVRALRPGGTATVMVYNRNSIWFWWNITILLGTLMWLLNQAPAAVRERLVAARHRWSDLVLPRGQRLQFADVVRAGTDCGGLQNPLSRVYTKRSVRRLFPGLANFRFVTQFNQFRAPDAQPRFWTVLARRVLSWHDRRWGWFLIVHASKPLSRGA